MKKEFRPISYPDGHAACPAGQKKVAEEAMILAHTPDSEEAKAIRERAKKGKRAVNKGADTNKRNLLSLVAVSLFQKPDEYIDPESGEYTLHGPEGKKYQRHAPKPEK